MTLEKNNNGNNDSDVLDETLMKENFNYNFNVSFGKLLKIEGGYADDPADSGGKTRYGITEKVARKYGYKGKMDKLPLEIAKAIYFKDYWQPMGLEELATDSMVLCDELFDSAVNVGVVQASRWLQKSLNVLNDRGKRWDEVAEDGVIGAATIAVVRTACMSRSGESRLFKALNCLQGAFYINLAKRREKDERFIGGWLDQRVKFFH